MSITPLLQDLSLSRSTIDRCAHLRKDSEAVAHSLTLSTTRVVPIFRATAPVNQQGALCFVSPAELREWVEPGNFFFLGRDEEGDYFCAPVTQEYVDHHAPDSWRHLRSVGAALTARDAGLLVAAVALTNWHDTHTRCPRCGEKTYVSESGWTRTCPRDASVHFPRTDPAVIMLVTDHVDRALLAQQVRWQPGWMSVLAGFVESGESAEAAVVREVFEEVGVQVDPRSLQYWGSQPWPFPNSLMLGYHVHAAPPEQQSGLIELSVDGDEIAHAQWFSRTELIAASGSGEIHLPPPVSIAHRLITTWLGEPLPRESAFR